MNYKAIISYKGTNFHGWAIQNDVLTIQGFIEGILYDLFGYKIKINTSGRTDAYVHANEQVINFSHDKLNLKPKEILNALNSRLGNDIRVHKVQIVDNKFHARYSAIKKTYCYKINTNKKYNVHEHDIIYQYNKDIDLAKIRKILPLFIKKQDFLSFSTSTLENSIRTITDIKIKKNNDYIEIYITANGFLRNMVRMIVGSFLAYNENKIDIETIVDCFKNPKKGKIIYKAPGCGLYLYKVFY